MSLPEIIILALALTSLLLYARDHGKPKPGKDNFWVGLTAQLISLGLMYWAGLFH